MASGNKEIDVSAGALVWVRRQNGSWWPGRVAGPDELLPCRSKRSKTGTPIRLLGREDGSLDWYNLERSTRVKSFRCGEYDELIEKTKVDSALRANRKSTGEGKYVRREDAILHALELEKAHNFVENQKLGSVTTDRNFTLQSNCKKQVHMARTHSGFKKSRQELSQSVATFEHLDKFTANGMHLMQRKRRRTPNDSEDDATEGMKRMRDLQDLVLGMVTKSEPKVHLQTKRSCGLAAPDNVSLSDSDFENDFSGVSPMNSSKDSTSSLKRKRTRVIQAYEDSGKKSRHRSLGKIWAGSTKIKSNSVYHGDAIGGQSFLQGVKHTEITDHKSISEKPDFPSVFDSPDSSGTSCEENLFDMNDNNYIATISCQYVPSTVKSCQNPSILESVDNDFSGGFIDVPVVVGVKNTTDLSPTFGPCAAAKFNSCSEKDQPNCCIQLNEGLGDTCSTGYAAQTNPVRQKIDMGSSEWHSKGKRNLKYPSLTKNIDRDNQSVSCLVNSTEKENMDSTSDESPISDSSGQLTKCMLLSEVGDLPGDQTHKTSSLIDGTHNSAGENGHAYPTEAVYAPENGALLRGEEISSVVPPRVPLPPRHIRLPSRYRTSEQQSSIGSLYDVELNVQTSYQAKRVPLVSLMSKLNGRAIVGHPITVEVLAAGVDHAIECLLKDKTNNSSKSRANGKQLELQEKTSGATMVRCPLLARKSNHGKKSGFSPRKIRRLSSFTADRKKEDKRRSIVEKIGGPTVSCIPLRLVFSRLNSALSNSARPAN